jgi:Bromodomain
MVPPKYHGLSLISFSGSGYSPAKAKKKAKLDKHEAEHFDRPEKWHEIALQHISKVTKGILAQLVRCHVDVGAGSPDLSLTIPLFLGMQRDLDTEQLFWIPVAEAYPDLGDAYLAHISEPMDFRTIEEERLLYYSSITQLQDDLILVFQNCMDFNEPDSPVYETARYVNQMNVIHILSQAIAYMFTSCSVMMGLLGDTFTQVCDALHVRCRHH